MYTCADCGILACAKEERGWLPVNCPMRDEELFADILSAYEEPETRKFYITSSAIEAEGYCKWPRLKETIEFCKKMEYHTIGLAFCKGLKKRPKSWPSCCEATALWWSP